MDRYEIISGDTHLEVPTDRWTRRVAEKHRDRAPRTVRLENGGDGFLIEGEAVRENAFDLYGGKGRDAWGPFGQTYESTAGTASPADRLECLERDNVDAELIFPPVFTGPKVWRSIADNAPYLAVVRAYNEFIAEDYAAFAPDRFFPVGVIPLSGLEDALAELRFCVAAGLRAVVLSCFPSGKGYPTEADDAFWQAALEAHMPLTVHIDLDRTGPRDGPWVEYERRAGIADLAPQVAKFARGGAINAVQMILGGVFDRFPELRIFMAENQVGWVPTFMTVADERYRRHLGWARDLLGFHPLPNGEPSDYVKRHILWGIQRDPAGVELRHRVGTENIIWGSDFPHQESEYPNSRIVLDENFGDVPDDDRFKMSCGNAMEFLHLEHPNRGAR